MSAIKHLLFDNDGTIVDSEIIAVRIILRMLKPLGFEMSESEYCQRFPGLLTRDILAIIQSEYRLQLPTDFITKLHEEHNLRFDRELRTVPGMFSLFKNLKTPKSVVSNGSARHVVDCLKRVRLSRALDGRIFSAEQVTRPKPYADLYLFALDELGHAPADVLVIEDSPTGVQAAKAAGLRVIGLLGATHIFPGHEKKLQDTGADYIANNAAELKAVLNKFSVD